MSKEKHCDVWVNELRVRFECECGKDIDEYISDIDENIPCPTCERVWEVLRPYELQDCQSGTVGLVGEEEENG